MKTTLDLPVNLLEEAMRVGKCGTKTATIIRALEQMVREVVAPEGDARDYARLFP